MTDINYLLIILVSLVFGSFVGAVTYRIPRRLGFVKGRSFCDSCHREIKWIYNIPLISYLVLRGKSACCHKKISARYFLIEITSLLAGLYLYTVFSLSAFIFSFLIFLLCFCIFIIDIEHQIIPDELVWLLLILALLPPVLGIGPQFNLYEKMLAGFLPAVLLISINIATRGRGMGLGDVKLAIPLGMMLGLYNSLNWFVGAFLTGGIVASILLIVGRAKWKQKIAFGPFLIVSFLYFFLIK